MISDRLSWLGQIMIPIHTELAALCVGLSLALPVFKLKLRRLFK